MKKLFVIVSLLLVTMVVLFGCGKTDNSTQTQNVLPPQEYNKTFTLQGRIMNAITGAPIGNDATGTITLFLIQGDADRGPTKLHTDPNDPLVGEYSISGIPADRSVGEAMFKVVVNRGGYQPFAANVNFDAVIAAGTVNIDGTLNKIGNIYLFPIGATPGDVIVNVVSNHGIPLPGATVLLQQDVFNNQAVAITSSNNGLDTNRLPAVGGLYTSMTATTDANGVATFSGANLVLGGSYHTVVEAINFQGDELATTPDPSGAFTVGINTANRRVQMAAITSFFAVTASNDIPGTITPSGILSITFNEPITMTSTRCFASISDGVITSGTLTFTLGGINGNLAPIDGVLSNNNTILTFTPNITTAPSVTALGATVTYSGCAGTIILQASQTAPATNTLFTGAATDVISRRTGAAVSGAVQLTSN